MILIFKYKLCDWIFVIFKSVLCSQVKNMFWKSAIDLALCGLLIISRDQVDLIILAIFTWTQVDKLNDSMLERSI